MKRKIIGIDPSSLQTGIGLIETDNNCLHFIGSQIITCRKTDALGVRLKNIFDELSLFIKKHQPQSAALEKSFYAVNAKTALILGHVRGAIMVCLQLNGIPVFEYSPNEVKLATVGRGKAGKSQVSYMVKVLLNIKEKTLSHDESDALATAICHFNRQGWDLK